MYIVDYTEEYRGRTVKTEVFEGDKAKDEILAFVARKSIQQNFELLRINQYKYGRLHPYELKLKQGRMVIEEVPDLPLTPAPPTPTPPAEGWF